MKEIQKIDLEQFEGKEIKGENGITHTVIMPNPQGKLTAQKVNEIIEHLSAPNNK